MEEKGGRSLGPLITFTGALLLITGGQADYIEAKVGRSITLNVTYTGDFREITWKLDNNKLVELTPKNPNPFDFYNDLQGRATIDIARGNLTIRNLIKEDSGQYRAEVLLPDSALKPNEITLAVCEDPVIYDQSTKEKIELFCNCSSSDVIYEWWNMTDLVSKGQKYSRPRPNEDVNMTCVVDNGKCKSSAFISIIYTPGPHGLPGGAIFGIIFCVLAFLAAIVIGVLWWCKHGRKNTSSDGGDGSKPQASEPFLKGEQPTNEPIHHSSHHKNMVTQKDNVPNMDSDNDHDEDHKL